jgi:dihydropteroate synthase
MHRQGDAADMQLAPHYGDVVAEITEYLVDRADRATAAGVSDVWIDPGIGFGKTLDHNLELLAATEMLAGLGYPLLVGTSRKSFLGVLAVAGPPSPVEDRLPGSLATATWAMQQGAAMVRVHDVAATVQAATLVGRPVQAATRVGGRSAPGGASPLGAPAS